MRNRTWIKAAQIGLVVGLLAIVSGVIAIVHHPGKDDSPTCGGRPMLKTDTCIEHYRDGTTSRRSYEDMKGHYRPAVAWSVLVGGVVVSAASVWVWRRNRERPFEFAPFHIQEISRKD